MIGRSLWLEETLQAEPGTTRPPLEGTVEADVCIVGGGFTGLWTALAITAREPSARVVILEADICAGGASGRNGGFVLSWWSKFTTLEQVFGQAEAVRIGQATADAVGAIGAFAGEQAIDCGFRRDGYIWTATSLAQVGGWQETLEALARAGVADAFAVRSQAGAAEMTGSPVHRAGVFDPSGATCQPAALARGLARVAEQRGVTIHERSAMTRLERSSPAVVRTAGGEVRAGSVVLAMNAWAARLPELQPWLVVTSSDIIATDPIADRLAHIGWTDGIGISDGRRLVNYYRTTPDGRVVFGKGGGTLARGGVVGTGFEGPSGRVDEVRRHFHRAYPALWDVDETTSWRGPIDYSVGGLPFLFRLPAAPAVIACAGFSGNGVGPSHLYGQAIADMALGRSSEWSVLERGPDSLRRLPPEPARWLGGLAVREAIARRELAEDSDRSPARIWQRLASIDPTSFH